MAKTRRTAKPSGSQPAIRYRAARGTFRRQSTISQWGNSLGVRIPQDAADKLNLSAGARVTVDVRGETITIRPVRSRSKWTEAALLAGMTPGASGGELDWGAPVAREIW